MRSNASLAQVDWARRSEPDDLPEWMDQPGSDEELRACLRDLGQVNSLSAGYRPTFAFLEKLLARERPKHTMRILDVGFGGGDTLHRIARWCDAQSLRAEFTGIDINPAAARIAEERFGSKTIRWVCGDAFSYAGQADVVFSSLLTHHLPTPEIVRFLAWMERTAAWGWFINDLERSRRSASLFSVLSGVMRWHKFVQHDGPVSFARSFVPADWQRMLNEAGIESGAPEILRAFPARLCVSRFK